jgi:AraC-like DNA-binding protein
MDRPDDRRWSGCLALGPWWVLYTGAFGPTAEHRHHAAQVLVSPSPVAVALDAEVVVATMIVVPADVPHRIVEGSANGTVMFVDGDTQRRGTLAVGAAPPPLATLGFDAVRTTYPEAAATAEALSASIGASAAPRDSLSPAIDGSIRLLDGELTVRAADLAARVGLSASEFSRRFSREVGLPFRSYRKWRRLLLAIEALAGGANLTVAAHAAGFADSAHLTRTFKAMFGIAPSDLTATSRWLPPA